MESKRVRFTIHAVERFIERCAPGCSYADAMRLLKEVLATAVRLDVQSDAEVWASETYECRLVIRRSSRGARCVTVLTGTEDLGATTRAAAITSAYHYISHRAERGDPHAIRALERLHAAGINFGLGAV